MIMIMNLCCHAGADGLGRLVKEQLWSEEHRPAQPSARLSFCCTSLSL